MKNTNPVYTKIQFLKLGGSLITDKENPRRARLGVIANLVDEIRNMQEAIPSSTLLLGHGSGSFGHVPANYFHTRQGVTSSEEWQGFAEVWWEAASLNRIVMESLHGAGLPALSFPVSASATSNNGRIIAWNLEPIKAALQSGILPVVFGDVLFDTLRGGTILSTEEIFIHLALELHPSRILLAGIEEGVWIDYPNCTELAEQITPESWESFASNLTGSSATDVTGGMASKVKGMLELVEKVPGVEVRIFSGVQSGNLTKALKGERIGTRLSIQRDQK